jgi:4-carboxymuconolactone decarboxylase
VDKDLMDKGLQARKAVLGEAYVNAAMSRMDAFNEPLQQLVSEYCWGAIWTRPGLDRKTRSLLNLAMLTALNRGHEFKLHVQGALNNGVTRDEIMETLLQATVYAGVPAGVEAFRLAREVFESAK